MHLLWLECALWTCGGLGNICTNKCINRESGLRKIYGNLTRLFYVCQSNILKLCLYMSLFSFQFSKKIIYYFLRVLVHDELEILKEKNAPSP